MHSNWLHPCCDFRRDTNRLATGVAEGDERESQEHKSVVLKGHGLIQVPTVLTGVKSIICVTHSTQYGLESEIIIRVPHSPFWNTETIASPVTIFLETMWPSSISASQITVRFVARALIHGPVYI